MQTFGRSGTLFLTEQLGVVPDVICLAKGAVVGATLGRASFAPLLHSGWHSNTFGGGKIFDVNFAYAVVDTVAHERSPVFDGLGYPAN
ncbi:MAG: aminotransferase class III-fold pyridoxal phosphate-dependent enzyme, partial [Planctomycetota bacterium]